MTEETRDLFRTSLTNCVKTLSGLMNRAKRAEDGTRFCEEAREIIRQYQSIRALSILDQRELSEYDSSIRRAMQYFEIV